MSQPRSERGVGGRVENARVFFIPFTINETKAMGFSAFQLLGDLMHNHFVLRNGEAEIK